MDIDSVNLDDGTISDDINIILEELPNITEVNSDFLGDLEQLGIEMNSQLNYYVHHNESMNNVGLSVTKKLELL